MNCDPHGATALAHVDLHGSPAEMGRQHGAALAQLIPTVLENHRPAGGLTPALLDALRRVADTLAATDPDVLAELRGIADGAGLPYEDLLWLNAGYEAQGDSLPHRPFCTAVGLPNTPEGPLVAKTDDVGLEQRCFEVLFRSRPAQGHAHLRYGFAGTVWNQGGMNAAGLALAMTGIPPAGQRNRDGIPGLILLQQMLLHCATVDEALAYARAHPLRGYGFTVTVADATGGDVTVAEVSGAADSGDREDRSPTGTVAVLRAAREPTVRTNHRQCTESLTLRPDLEWQARYGDPALLANSEGRFSNAQRLAGQTPWTVEGLKTLLADHSVAGAICQHGQAGLHTSIAMIMVPWRRKMVVSEGYGCGVYTEYTI